jgi:hypothetical protein
MNKHKDKNDLIIPATRQDDGYPKNDLPLANRVHLLHLIILLFWAL